MRLAILILALVALVAPAASYTYEISQGESAYYGDTADLSQVVTWPDFQLAWCDDQSPGCFDPHIVDLGYENQHRVSLVGDRWRLGNYYRWAGSWDVGGENIDGFTLLEGPRPPKETVVVIANETYLQSEVVMPGKNLPNATHILLARGDAITYEYAIPNKTEGNKAFFWIFPMDAGATGSAILGEQMQYRSNDSVYSFEFNQSLSESLIEGRYEGYIQYSGANNRQDIFYRPNHQMEKFETPGPVLDTLYDDDIVPDISLTGLTPPLVKEQFDNLAETEYSDDNLISVTMDIATPALAFMDYYSLADNLTVSGFTTASPGTMVVFRLDPDHYALEYDIMAHTWSAEAVGGINERRSFNISMPINWDEMATGNHTVLATIDKYRYHADTVKDFRVGYSWVEPTPTPAIEKVVLEEYGIHRITPNATPVIAAITPTLVPSPTVQQNVTSVNATVTQETTIIPATPTRTKVPPTTPAVTIPLGPVALLALIGAAVVWRKYQCQKN